MIPTYSSRARRKIRWTWKIYFSRHFIAAFFELARMARATVLAETPGAECYAAMPPTTYVPHNGSIVRTPRGWLVAVRAANYRITARGNEVEGGPQNLDAETWLVELDDTLAVRESRLLLEAPHRDPDGPAKNGLADPRLFLWREQLWALWTAEMLVSNDWSSARNQMALGLIRDGSLAELHFLRSPYDRVREKNWMPWVRGEQLLLVYKINPLEVYALVDGSLQLLHRSTRRHPRLRDYSGSSQLAPWGDDWICAVHYGARATYATVTRHCHYMHRFVILSDSFEVKAISREFFIEAKTTEFCAGLAVTGRNVLLSYGLRDRESRIVRLESEHVARLF